MIVIHIHLINKLIQEKYKENDHVYKISVKVIPIEKNVNKRVKSKLINKNYNRWKKGDNVEWKNINLLYHSIQIVNKMYYPNKIIHKRILII